MRRPARCYGAWGACAVLAIVAHLMAGCATGSVSATLPEPGEGVSLGSSPATSPAQPRPSGRTTPAEAGRPPASTPAPPGSGPATGQTHPFGETVTLPGGGSVTLKATAVGGGSISIDGMIVGGSGPVKLVGTYGAAATPASGVDKGAPTEIQPGAGVGWLSNFTVPGDADLSVITITVTVGGDVAVFSGTPRALAVG